MAAAATDTIRYHVTGMDCSSCAAKIEGAARKVDGVNDVKVSIASQIMTLEVDDPARRLSVVESAITDLGYQLDRVGQPKAEGTGDDDDDDKIPDLSHVTPAYKRALWIVVLLNVGYGIIEIGGSILSGSQLSLVPDVLAHAGGVTVSYFEWAQNRQFYHWNLDRVRQELERVMTHAFDAVWDLSRENQVSLRTAAFMVGINRVARATALGGLE